jgi:hypothetical protein
MHNFSRLTKRRPEMLGAESDIIESGKISLTHSPLAFGVPCYIFTL